MPTNTSLTINSTQDGKKVTDKISYVNPNITKQQAIDLAQTFNALTNNAYVSTTRQDTTELDTEPKQVRTVKHRGNCYIDGVKKSNQLIENLDEINVGLSQTSAQSNPTCYSWGISSFTEVDDPYIYPQPFFTIDSENVLENYSGTWRTQPYGLLATYSSSFALHSKTPQTITVTLHIPETEHYAEYEKTWTINFFDDEEG